MRTDPVKSALLVQPSLQPPGGGNAVAAWMLEALRGQYTLSVFTWEPLDVAPINDFYGTSLSADEIAAAAVPAWLRIPIDAVPMPLALLKTSLLMRLARRHTSTPDVVLSANNEMDLGRRGIQYVHYPAYLRPRPFVELRWYHFRWMVAAYHRLCDWIADPSERRMLANLTLVNSDWTGRRFRARHGGETRTVYPPVAGPRRPLPWTERRNDFVCLSRISPEKDLDTIIDIVAAVRRRHPEARLHVVGNRGPWRYTRRILRRMAAHADWIHLHLDLPRDEMHRVIAASRYGLHAMRDEHFGIAPAEMAAGGCIVWVHNSGGPLEIVNGDPRLTFDATDDAVSKILRVMADPVEQAALRAALAQVTPRFARERFLEGIRGAVDLLASADRDAWS